VKIDITKVTYTSNLLYYLLKYSKPFVLKKMDISRTNLKSKKLFIKIINENPRFFKTFLLPTLKKSLLEEHLIWD